MMSNDFFTRNRAIAAASPLAVRQTVHTLRMHLEDGCSLERSLQREADTQAICYNGPDMKEGLDAILEKRPPKFSNCLLSFVYVFRL